MSAADELRELGEEVGEEVGANRNGGEPSDVHSLDKLRRRGSYKLASGAPAEGFRDYLEDLCNGAELVKVRQLGAEGERWHLVLRVGETERVIELTPDDLGAPKSFKLKVWRAVKVTPRLRRGELDDVLDAIGEAIDSDIGEVVDSGLSPAEEAREWISAFIESGNGPGLCDPSDSAELYSDILSTTRNRSFLTPEGRLYIRLQELTYFINRDYGQRATVRGVANRLAALGFENAQLSARPPGGGNSRNGRFWVSPAGFEV